MAGRAPARRPAAGNSPRKRGVTPKAGAPKAPTPVEFGVIGIGASAGGLEPISTFFDNMPADSGMAFVVIQHLDPGATSLLPELLARHTQMPVRAATDGAAVSPNTVHVIAPGTYLTSDDGALHMSATQAGLGARLPIDRFLTSLAQGLGPRGIGIILSGTGTDGGQGLKALKDAGGFALVQSPAEAAHDGMPRNAIETAHPDLVLPVAEMPAALSRHAAPWRIRSGAADRTAGAETRFTGQPLSKDDPAGVTRLERELTETRAKLNRTIHDLRRVNADMKIANEDAMSLNEELTSVNAQMRQSLDQHRRTSGDLTNLLNSSNVATIVLDASLRIKIFNARMKSLFAVIDSDVGRPLADLPPKFTDPLLLPDAQAACVAGTPSKREIRADSGDWYLRMVQPYRTGPGDIEGAVVTFTDVTRMKQIEFDAAAARALAETTVDTVTGPLAVLDQDHRILRVNAAFPAAFHLTPDQIDGRAPKDLANTVLAHPDLTALLSRAGHAASGNGQTDLEIDEPNGGFRVWVARARPFTVPPADKPMVLLALDDVTERRRLVIQQVRLIIDAVPGACVAVDAQRRMRLVSERTGALFGYAVSELEGRTIDMLVPVARRDVHAGLHNEFMTNPSRRPMGTGVEVLGLTRDGLEIPLEISLTPVPTAEGPMVLAVIHDLRAQKLDETRLRDAKTEAEQASRAKSHFLTAVSHDLRQPLQTVKLLLSILERQTSGPDARTTIGKLGDTVTRMAGLLTTLLELGQVEAGELRPEVTDVSIAALLERTRDEFTPIAAAKGLSLRIVPSSVRVLGDVTLLMRMLANLVGNAIKYTPRGRVLLGCRRRGGNVRIEVWDTGLGIPEDSLDAIFDEFHRVEHGGDSPPGIGLGLSIVRRYAELLGYTVDVRSRVGRGSVFALTVPRVTGVPAPLPGEKPAMILLIEDDPAQLSALRALLNVHGYPAAAARDCGAALNLTQGPNAIRPSVIVTDYNLERGLTGLDAIARIRAALGARVPAIVVTADQSGATRRMLEAAGEVSISKPYRVAELLGSIDRLLGPSSGPGQGGRGSA